MGKDKYICPCFKVTKADIKKAIADGAGSFKEVKKATHLAAGCGHCKCRAKSIRRNGWGNVPATKKTWGQMHDCMGPPTSFVYPLLGAY